MAQIKSINLIHGRQSGKRPIRSERLSSFWRSRLLIICTVFSGELWDWLLLCITAGSSGVSGQTEGRPPSTPLLCLPMRSSFHLLGGTEELRTDPESWALWVAVDLTTCITNISIDWSFCVIRIYI